MKKRFTRNLLIGDAACSGSCTVSDFHCIYLHIIGQSSFAMGSSSTVKYRRSSELLDEEADASRLEDYYLSDPEKANTPTKRIGTAIMDMTVEDSSVCVLWKRTGLFHKPLHQ